MAATPRKIVVDVEPGVALAQTRVRVSLLAQDAQTVVALAAPSSKRGPFLMSPRNFVTGQFFRAGDDYFRIQGVIHDPMDPAGVTLLVSVVKNGIVPDGQP